MLAAFLARISCKRNAHQSDLLLAMMEFVFDRNDGNIYDFGSICGVLDVEKVNFNSFNEISAVFGSAAASARTCCQSG